MKTRSLLIAVVGILFITGIFFVTKKQSSELNQKQEVSTASINEDSLRLVDGIFTSPQRENVAQFSLQLPKEWEVKNFNGGEIFSVEFVNGNYTLQIFQPYEGNTCVFPGDKPYEGPSEVFDKAIALQTSFGLIKIGRNPIDLYGDQVIFRACSQKYGFTENGQMYLGTGTQIGNIQYFVPKSYDENKIKEMNALLQTIKLVK